MKRMVIVVDDEVESPAFSLFRKAVARGDFSSYAFVWCAHCEAALREIEAYLPYAVLLDLNFPPGEMQGSELLAKIREKDPLRSIPIMVLTSVDSLGTAVDTMREGASDYIPKAKGAVSLAATELDLLAAKLEQVGASHYRPYSRRIAAWYNVNAARCRDVYAGHVSGRGQRKSVIPKKQIEAGLIDTRKRVFDSHLVSGSRNYSPALVGSIPELLLHNVGWHQWHTDLPTRLNFTGRGPELRDDVLGALPVVLFHALGAAPDSIALIADLGRAFRLSTLWGSSRRIVMIAGPAWGAANIANRRHIPDDRLLMTTLREQLTFRLKLYSAAGYEAYVFDFPDGSDATAVTVNKTALVAEAENALAAIAQRGIDARDLTGLNREEFLERVQPIIAGMSRQKGLVDRLSAELLLAAWDIEGVWERDVMVYFLAQEAATLGIGGEFVKIAVDSERPFDQAIGKRMAVRGKNDRGGKMAFYFRHYELGGKRILPYNPLSLDFVDAEPSDVRGTILLDGSTDKAPTSVLLGCSGAARARLLGDCLCFLHLLAIQHGRTHSADIEALFESVRRIDDELGISVAYYIQSQGRKPSDAEPREAARERLLAWVDGIDAHGFVHLPLPYFAIPYVWYQDEWEQKAGNIVDFLCQIAALTNRIVKDHPDTAVGSAGLGFKMQAYLQASDLRTSFSDFSSFVKERTSNFIGRHET